jgi:hypothetical protein
MRGHRADAATMSAWKVQASPASFTGGPGSPVTRKAPPIAEATSSPPFQPERGPPDPKGVTDT